MLPICLKIEGFYSYKNVQVLDFEALYKDKIFGVFGAVGSGKSAILDAITLSLYGSVDRLNSKERRNYNILNLNSNKLLIEFTFKSSNNIYQFVVNARRNKNNFDKIEDFEHKAYKKQNDSWIPIPLLKTSIAKLSEKILGLNYENFNRTIIIPQGKFQEFLKLSPSERTNMLSEIFGLQKYDLYAGTFSRYKITKEKYDVITGKIENLNNYSIESLNQSEKEFESCNTEIQKINKQIIIFTTEEKTLSETLKFINERNRLLGYIKNEETNKHLFIKKRNSLLIYEHCKNNYSELLSLINKDTNNLENTKNNYKETQIDIKAIAKPIEQNKLQLDTLNVNIKNKDKIYQKIKEIKSELQLRVLSKDLAKLNNQLLKLEDVFNQRENSINQLRYKLTQLEDHSNNINSKIIKQETIDNIYAWHITSKTLNQSYENLTNIKNDKIKNIEKQKQQILSLLEKYFPDYKAKYKTFKDLKDLIEKKFIDLISVKSLNNIYKNLNINDKCPICNNIIKKEHIQNFQKKNVEELTLYEDLITKQSNYIKEIEIKTKSYNTNRKEAETEISKYNEALKNEHNKINEHNSSYKWNNLVGNSYDNFIKFRNQQYDIINSYNNTKESIKNVNIKISDTNLELEKLKQQITLIKTQISVQKSKQNYILQSFIITTSSHYKLLQDDDLNKKIQEKEKFLNDINNLYDKSLQTFQTLSNKETRLKEKNNILQNEIIKLEETIQKSNEQLDIKLHKDDNLKELLKNLNPKISDNITDLKNFIIAQLQNYIDINSEKEKLDNFFKQLYIAQEKISDINKYLEANPYNAEHHKEIKTKINELESTKNKLIHQQGTLNERINNINKKLQEVKNLKHEYNILQNRIYNLEILLNMFHGKGFMQYISQAYLHNICLIANKHFTKMNNNALSIEFKDDQFLVRDYFNQGKLRHIKTLSGGQIFQASLSMALALSDNLLLNTKTNKESFFFLDEGFGSLDKESINIVINTLLKLRKENRIIGVISHIDEIKEQIDNYISITNDEELGSSINVHH